jgi:hypothetical protein
VVLLKFWSAWLSDIVCLDATGLRALRSASSATCCSAGPFGLIIWVFTSAPALQVGAWLEKETEWYGQPMRARPDGRSRTFQLHRNVERRGVREHELAQQFVLFWRPSGDAAAELHFALSPSSTRRRTASERPVSLATPHASASAMSAAGILMVT